MRLTAAISLTSIVVVVVVVQLSSAEVRPVLFQYLARLRQAGEHTLGLLNLPARLVVDAWTADGDDAVPTDADAVAFVVDLVTFGGLHRKDQMWDPYVGLLVLSIKKKERTHVDPRFVPTTQSRV